METKKQWRGNEPWKNQEPGAKLKKEALNLQVQSERERAMMENRSTQEVRVKVLHDRLWKMEHYNRFIVTMKIPLRETEIFERMQKAFPNLELIVEGS